MVTTGYEQVLEMLDLSPLAEEDLSPDEVAEVDRRAAEMGIKPGPDVHQEQAWTDEIIRRVQDLRAGRIHSIPAADAFAQARERVRNARG